MSTRIEEGATTPPPRADLAATTGDKEKKKKTRIEEGIRCAIKEEVKSESETI